MNVVFILIDGFRYDYLSPEFTPVLCRVAEGENVAVSRAREPFGFQSRPAFLAGLYPEESGVCMLFKYSPDTSPFGRIGPLSRLGGVPKLGCRLRRRIELRTAGLEGDIYRYLHTTAQVPLSLLPYFDYSEKELPWEARYATPTIFDVVRRTGGSFIYLGWPVYSSPHEDDRVVKDMLESLQSTHRFVFVQLALLDGLGHAHGPDSAQLARGLEETDRRFGLILDALKKNMGDFVLFAYGDHGMVGVQRYLNLWEKLKAAGPRLGRDYIVFLDSTTARFWFREESARGELAGLIRGIEGGRILEGEDMAKHHIVFKDRSYGDMIFLADPGSLIHPSFFSRGVTPRGMHGYDPDFHANQGIFVMATSRPEAMSVPEVVDHVDLYATAVRLLGHEHPPLAHGRNLIQS